MFAFYLLNAALLSYLYKIPPPVDITNGMFELNRSVLNVL